MVSSVGAIFSINIEPTDNAVLIDGLDSRIRDATGLAKIVKNESSRQMKEKEINEASEIILSGTAIGQVNKDRALMKSGFNVGDLVCISGEIGLAALGFELLRLREILNNNLFELIDIKEKIDKSYEIDSSLCDMAIFKALKPEAKYAEGHILSNYNSENSICATDITDGLASEFYEILDSDKKFMAIESNNSYSELNNEYSESFGKVNSKEINDGLILVTVWPNFSAILYFLQPS